MGAKGDTDSSSLDVDDILGVSSEDEDDVESLKSAAKPTSVPVQKPSFLSSNPNPTTTPSIRVNTDSGGGAQSMGQKDPFASFNPSGSTARPTSAFVLPSSGVNRDGGGGDVPNHASSSSSRPRPDLNASQPFISSNSKPNPLSNEFLLSSLGIKPKTSEPPVNQSSPGFDLFGKSGNPAIASSA